MQLPCIISVAINSCSNKAGNIVYRTLYINTLFLTVKVFLKRYKDFINSYENLKYPLLIAYSQITS